MSNVEPPRPGYTRDGYNDAPPVVERTRVLINWPLVAFIQLAIINVPLNVILWKWAL